MSSNCRHSVVYISFSISGDKISVCTLTNKQGVALTGRNTTGPWWSVGRPAVLQTTTYDRRRQTPASETILAH